MSENPHAESIEPVLQEACAGTKVRVQVQAEDYEAVYASVILNENLRIGVQFLSLKPSDIVAAFSQACDDAGIDAPLGKAEAVETPAYRRMKKDELLAQAEIRGLDVEPGSKKDVIIEALEDDDVETLEGGEES